MATTIRRGDWVAVKAPSLLTPANTICTFFAVVTSVSGGLVRAREVDGGRRFIRPVAEVEVLEESEE
jgi:hypothetical protein